MPLARLWTKCADETIVEMRKQGYAWSAIGRVLSLSRNTVIERGRRLQAAEPSSNIHKSPKPEFSELELANRAPLASGHPLTWRLISSEPYPGEFY